MSERTKFTDNWGLWMLEGFHIVLKKLVEWEQWIWLIVGGVYLIVDRPHSAVLCFAFWAVSMLKRQTRKAVMAIDKSLQNQVEFNRAAASILEDLVKVQLSRGTIKLVPKDKEKKGGES